MIQERLKRVRAEEGMSLREFARAVEERAGYEVSHSSVSHYEKERAVPARYVSAVAEAFDVDPRWLLEGEGRPPAGARQGRAHLRELDGPLPGAGEDGESAGHGAEHRKRVKRAWERFREGLPPDSSLRDVVLRSWRRSRSAGLDAGEGPVRVPRVSPRELDELRERNARLLEAAGPHLEWLSDLMGNAPHVAYLVSAGGVVLDAAASPPELAERQRLSPGHVWSEEAMGTNGAGTALVEGRPVAVLGPEHFLEAFHDAVCTGAPVRSPSGEVVGALDLSTDVEHGDPWRLIPVTYAAAAVERKLEAHPPSSGPPRRRA